MSADFECFQLLKALEYIASIHGKAELAAGDFNRSKICWFFKTAPLLLLNFACESHVGGWTQHAGNPTKGIDILHLLPNVDTCVLDNFSRCV